MQAKAMVEGFTNPVYRGFKTPQEAAEFLAQHGSSSSSSSSGRGYGTVRGAGDDGASEQQQQQSEQCYE
jgi:hypothetical protein